MKKLLLAALLVLLSTLPAQAARISVFAAASLTDAFNALAAGFEKSQPGDTLALTFAASGELLRRMESGEPADVFASADTATMDAAADKQRILPTTRIHFAVNTLVLAAPAGNPARVAGLESLLRGGVRRIGVGNPESVPAGRYAKQALHQKALWFALTAKLTYFPSVRHVLAALANGSIDAGFVYATDAAMAGPSVTVVETIPLSPPVTYAAAVTTAAKDKAVAAAFLAYLASPEARAVLARFGFGAP